MPSEVQVEKAIALIQKGGGNYEYFFQQLSNQFLCRFVGQLALLVEMFVSVGEHDFGLIDGIHVEKHEHLPQVILRACRAD